ncbi:MAG: ribonuclease J, partial [Microcoleus sp.]
GEPMAAMTRIANGEHHELKIRKGDTVIFSANPIPGNTIAVVNTIDKLMMLGANVIYGRDKGIHVSGHGCQEDQKLMINMTRPKFFLPVHGEHRMLVQHSKTAQSMGIPASNMVIIDNGDVVELTENSMRLGTKVPSGIELVDSSRSGVVKANVLKERQQLAGDGAVTVAAALNAEGKLVATPQIHLKGVVTSADRELLQQSITQTIETILGDRWSEFVRPSTTAESGVDVDWVGVQTQIERSIQRVLRRELQSNPMLVFLMQIPEGALFVQWEKAAVTPGSLEAPKLLGPSSTSAPAPAPAPVPANAVTGRRRPRTAAKVASVVS